MRRTYDFLFGKSEEFRLFRIKLNNTPSVCYSHGIGRTTDAQRRVGSDRKITQGKSTSSKSKGH